MRRASATAAIILWFAGFSVPVHSQDAVPAALEPWRAWVLHGHERARCPVPDADVTQMRCRWPGELALEANAEGLRFAQTWTLQARERVPLPGDARSRPVDVEVDGRPAAAALEGERPWLELDAGTHRITGRIAWSQRPSSLALPDEIALLALRIDGRAIDRPERNESGELLLGAQAANDADALSAEVYRLLIDGSPQLLATRVQFSVSGKPREQTFPALLPAGQLPVDLDSELPIRLEADGRLRAQLRAGQWSLTLLSRSDAPRAEFAPAAAQDPWPAQEIWQFRADPAFRTAQFSGVPGVDPQQVSIPDWSDALGEDFDSRWSELFDDSENLPAFLMQPGATAQLEISMRGLPTQRPPRLGLRRELWLDFDGGGFSARDQVSGSLGSAMRLDLRAPWSMQRAQRDGDTGLLITGGPEAGLTGVELRDGEVNLDIDARVERDGIARASGWNQPFDRAQAVLNLPPGYRLIAANGPDRASGSWWQAWNLLDLFLLCFGALLAWRAGGVALLVPALLWLVLAWHQPMAPRYSVVLLLLIALLARHVRNGRIGTAMRALRIAAFGLVVLFGLGFAVSELRLALHPQLEQAQVFVSRDANNAYGGRARMAQEAVQATYEAAPMPAAAPPMDMDSNEQNQVLEKIEVTGTRIKRSNLYSYPVDAVVQSGQARPDWQWQRHELMWNGPLLQDDTLQLIVSPPWLTRLWRIVAVLLLAVVLWRVLRDARSSSASPRVGAAAAAMLALGLLPAIGRAQALPDAELRAELRERLTARTALCRPNCGGLGAVQVNATRERLVLSLDAQAQDEQIWPLPRPDASLTLVSLRVDGVAATVRREVDGDVVHLARGVHRVELAYAPQGERWRIAFPLPPASVVLAAEGFESIGLDEERLIGDTLELVPPRVVASTSDAAEPVAPSEALPPFVRVHRSLNLDQRWELRTRIERVAPSNSGLNLRIPLVPGEQPFENAPPVRDAHAVVSLPAGVDEIEWVSRLEPSESYVLAAGDGRGYAEEWIVWASPLLHVEYSGLPESGQDEYDGAQRFLPLPGERLELRVTRPAAADGARLAFENVQLSLSPGQRARDARLSFEARASAAGQHRIALPAGAELLEFEIDGDEQPLVLEADGLRLPFATRYAVDRVGVARVGLGFGADAQSGHQPGRLGIQSAHPAQLAAGSLAARDARTARRSGGAVLVGARGVDTRGLRVVAMGTRAAAIPPVAVARPRLLDLVVVRGGDRRVLVAGSGVACATGGSCRSPRVSVVAARAWPAQCGCVASAVDRGALRTAVAAGHACRRQWLGCQHAALVLRSQRRGCAARRRSDHAAALGLQARDAGVVVVARQCAAGLDPLGLDRAWCGWMVGADATSGRRAAGGGAQAVTGMSVRDLLAQGAQRLGGDGARREAELLLGHALQRDRAWLFAHARDPLEPGSRMRFDELIARRVAGEPVAYITGQRGFWTLDLAVTPAVLVPRPETELLVETALQRLPTDVDLRVADLGTGSGAIALALAQERPRAHVVAIDASDEALAVARANAHRNEIANVEFRAGSWYEPLAGERFDLIASNPPYVAKHDPHVTRGDLRFEPRVALTSGVDGLDAIRIIAAGAIAHLLPGGWLLIEHGFDQGAALRSLLTSAGLSEIETRPDLEGRDRLSLGRRCD